MPRTWEPVRDMASTPKLILISGFSGLVWGLVGYWLVSDTNMSGGASVALMASPLIGVAVGVLALRGERLRLFGQILLALLNLYIAVAMFAAVVGAWHVTVGYGTLTSPESASRLTSFAASVGTSMLLFTVSGWSLLLWPLAIANHAALWRFASRSAHSDVRARPIFFG